MKAEELRLLKEKLPEFPGVQGREKYFNSAVLIPLILINKQYYFLFQRRAEGVRQAGEICFPGGKYDPETDKDYAQTAVRETVEELGIAQERIIIEGKLDTLLAPMGVLVDSFLGQLKIDSLEELSINKEEVEEVFCLPVSFFEDNPPEEYYVRLMVEPSYKENGKENILLPVKKLGLPERYSKPWGELKHRIYVYQTEKGAIWGITAELINEVVKHLLPK